MKYLDKLLTIFLLSICVVSPAGAGQLSGDLSVGYLLTDDENNQSLMYERYNNYDGAALSLNNFIYSNNGMFYRADLNNITMNNRNLHFSIYKPSVFTVSARHNKFRRIYDSNEQYSTKRDLTDVTADVTLNKNLGLFGSFTNHQNKGDRLYVSSDAVDSLASFVDYSSQVAVGGFRYSSGLGNLNASYSYTNYDDDDSLSIQKTDQINVNANMKIPGYDRYRIYGGFTYVKNKLDEVGFNQINYHSWAGTKIRICRQLTAEYRVLYNRNDHEAQQLETDTWHHLISLSRKWKSRFGIRIGYDYVIADDLLNRTKRNGYLVNGWARFNKQVFVKFELNFYDKEKDFGSTLYGNTNYNRNKVTVTYKPTDKLAFSGNYLSRFKENETILSKIDYSKFGGNITYRKTEFGKICAIASYSKGDYKNQSTTTSYQFKNFYLGGIVAPYITEKLSVSLKGSFYNLDKDTDFRKIIISGDFSYEFYENLLINVSVNSFNAEDYLLDEEYSGYLFAFNLVKHFEK